MLAKLQVSVSFHEILELVPKYVKFIKNLISRKTKADIGEIVALTKECSALLQRKLPPMLKDPRRFTIPYIIGEEKTLHALCDLGARINIMPLRLVKKLELGDT